MPHGDIIYPNYFYGTYFVTKLRYSLVDGARVLVDIIYPKYFYGICFGTKLWYSLVNGVKLFYGIGLS
jgi:hypothetical protein